MISWQPEIKYSRSCLHCIQAITYQNLELKEFSDGVVLCRICNWQMIKANLQQLQMTPARFFTLKHSSVNSRRWKRKLEAFFFRLEWKHEMYTASASSNKKNANDLF